METAEETSLAGVLEQNALIQVGLPISLAIIMVGVGLTLRAKDFHNVVYYPKTLILGGIAQVLLMPALAFGLAYALQLPSAIAVGLVVIASCPGGTTSNVFAFLAKGNLALSILLTAGASLITVMTIPLFTNMALQLFMEQSMDAPLRLPVTQTVVMLIAIIFVPVMLGMAVRTKAPHFATRMEGIVSAFGLLVLIALVVLIVYQTRNHLGELLMNAGPSVIALNLAGIVLGFAVVWIAGGDHRDGLTVAIELGIKNSTIGMMVTLTLLKSAEIAMPATMYGLLMYASAAFLVMHGRRYAGARPVTAEGEIPLHVPEDVGFPDEHPENRPEHPH